MIVMIVMKLFVLPIAVVYTLASIVYLFEDSVCMQTESAQALSNFFYSHHLPNSLVSDACGNTGSIKVALVHKGKIGDLEEAAYVGLAVLAVFELLRKFFDIIVPLVLVRKKFWLHGLTGLCEHDHIYSCGHHSSLCQCCTRRASEIVLVR